MRVAATGARIAAWRLGRAPLAGVLGWGVALAGALILLGWAVDAIIIPSGVAGAPAVKANAGLCFVLGGVGLVLAANHSAAALRRLLGALVAAVGIATLCEYAFGWRLGIDELLFSDPATLIPGRMAPNVALALALCGTALMLCGAGWGGRRLAETLALIAAAIAWIAGIGYAAGLDELVQVGRFVKMSVPSVLCLVALGLGLVLVARGEVAELLASKTPAGRLVRRLLLSAVAVAPLAAVLLRAARAACLLDAGEVILLLLASVVLTMLAVAFVFARSLDRAALERVQIESDLRQSERHHRQILEASLSAFVEMDADGVITAWNRSAEGLFGWTEAEAIGRTVAETIVPEQLRARHRAGVTRVGKGGVSSILGQRLELTAVHCDGRQFPVELTIATSETAGPARFHAFIHDISERVDAKRLMVASERRFRAIATEAPIGIVELDAQANCLFVNEHWTRMTGIGCKDATGTGWAVAIHPEDRDRVFADWYAMAGAGGRYEGELRYHDAAGGDGWAYVSSEPLTGDAGEASGQIGSWLDLTDRKRAERQLDRQNAELERSNEELSEFAYVASHDLQEPLRVIAGFVQLLRQRYRGRLDEDADRYIDATVSGTERMQALIDSLLSYSRVGTGELRLQRLDTGAIVQDVIAGMPAEITKTGVTVEVGELPVISGDSRLIEQLFTNLISNAVKFCDKQSPRVEVQALEENGSWHFSVADNGPGIEDRHRAQIFEMFKRLHGRSVPGTGIGLAISKKAAERHGGRIWVESDPGAGSTFHFTIVR